MQNLDNPLKKFESLKVIPITNKEKMIEVYEKLLKMDISNKENFLKFQEQRDLVEKHFINEWCESIFLMTIDVSNKENQRKKEYFDQVVKPLNTEYEEKLNKKFIKSAASLKLDPPFDLLQRNLNNKIEIFRQENVEINKKIDKTCNEITEIQAKRKAIWDGEEVPLPAISKHLKSANVDVRKKAYESLMDAKLKVSCAIDEKFTELLNYRNQIAKNCGFESYTQYKFKEMQRFDWGEAGCYQFHKAVKKYPVYEQASVFYNGTGLANDLIVLLHELGHCFHFYLSRHIKPRQLQDCSPEVGESPSTCMEYIGMEHLSHFLDADKCQKIKKDRLRHTISLFISCAQGDEFQHWLYSHPNHTSQMREEKWKSLTREYYPGVNFDGYLEQIAKVDWQFIHILRLPFYLIDYSISEILAITVWDRYKKSPSEGIKYYKNGCRLGASKTVPEIYEAFGGQLNFGDKAIAPLAKRIEEELGFSGTKSQCC